MIIGSCQGRRAAAAAAVVTVAAAVAAAQSHPGPAQPVPLLEVGLVTCQCSVPVPGLGRGPAWPGPAANRLDGLPADSACSETQAGSSALLLTRRPGLESWSALIPSQVPSVPKTHSSGGSVF